MFLVMAGTPDQAVHDCDESLRRSGQKCGRSRTCRRRTPVPLTRGPWHTDQLIKMSGLEWTILRPSASCRTCPSEVRAPTRGACSPLSSERAAPTSAAEGLRQQFAHIVRQGPDHAGVQSDDVERITGQPTAFLED